jgi:hypothetical protein
VNNRLVGFNFAVANMDDAVGPPGNLVFERDEDDGAALAV